MVARAQTKPGLTVVINGKTILSLDDDTTIGAAVDERIRSLERQLDHERSIRATRGAKNFSLGMWASGMVALILGWVTNDTMLTTVSFILIGSQFGIWLIASLRERKVEKTERTLNALANRGTP